MYRGGITCLNHRPEQARDPRRCYRVRLPRQGASGAFCSSQGRAPSADANVHAPCGDTRRTRKKCTRRMRTPHHRQWHRCKERSDVVYVSDGNGKRSGVRNDRFCLKCIDSSRKQRIRCLQTAINMLHLLKKMLADRRDRPVQSRR
jgi:hypothetical protein